jgi:hypothetical protein
MSKITANRKQLTANSKKQQGNQPPNLVLTGLLVGPTSTERNLLDEMFKTIGRLDDNPSTPDVSLDYRLTEHEEALGAYQLKYALAESLAHHGQSEVDDLLARIESQN